MHTTHIDGFSLIEVLVAMVLVAGAVATLASLGILGLIQNDASHDAGLALSLAQGKLDELRAATWRFDASGAPIGDPLLALTPPLTLANGGAATVELFDQFGQQVTTASAAAFRRRWSALLHDTADPDTLLLQSCVESIRGAATGTRQCLVTVRTRQP